MNDVPRLSLPVCTFFFFALALSLSLYLSLLNKNVRVERAAKLFFIRLRVYRFEGSDLHSLGLRLSLASRVRV